MGNRNSCPLCRADIGSTKVPMRRKRRNGWGPLIRQVITILLMARLLYHTEVDSDGPIHRTWRGPPYVHALNHEVALLARGLDYFGIGLPEYVTSPSRIFCNCEVLVLIVVGLYLVRGNLMMSVREMSTRRR